MPDSKGFSNKYRITIENFTPLRHTRYSKLSDLWWKYDQKPDSPEYISENFFALPSFFIVAKYKSKPVGLIFLFDKNSVFNTKNLKILGIGGVVVHPNFRRQGIATAMLRAAINFYIKKADLSILCTNIQKLAPLYSTVGFKVLGRSYHYINKSGKLCQDDDGMILGLRNKNIINQIQKSSTALNIGISNI